MNKDQLQGKWHQVKGAVKAQWGKLTNDDLDEIDGNLERLVGIVQERYGYARDRAAREVEDFQRRHASAAEEASRTR
ncbi:MAG TPA: CsbD family protein [Vicinamibacterales bacterium]|nr:CsbD family protein [Vicinamibacterales bacterium]